MIITGYVTDEITGEQRCPTETCRAACCRASHYKPGLPGPCNHLDQSTNTCGLHGTPDKPMGCSTYPTRQADIDMINKQAEAAGYSERCLLKVVEV